MEKLFRFVEKSQGCVVAQISPAQADGKLMAFWCFRSFTNGCHISATSNFRNGFKFTSAAGPNLKSFTTSMPAIRPRPWNQNCVYSVHYSLVVHFRKYITYFCSSHHRLHLHNLNDMSLLRQLRHQSCPQIQNHRCNIGGHELPLT